MSRNKKERKGLSIFLRILGIALILGVIIICIPLVFPKFMGYQMFNVVSPSMEPQVPVGSLVFVKETEPEAIEPGEIIAYQSGSTTITHRVVENHVDEKEFITKGDANATNDMNPIAYAALVGRVERHIPVLGRLLMLITSTLGKIYMLGIAACGVALNMLAARLRETE